MLCRGVSKRRLLNVGLVTNDKCITFRANVQMTSIPLKAPLLQMHPQKGMSRGESSQRQGGREAGEVGMERDVRGEELHLLVKSICHTCRQMYSLVLLICRGYFRCRMGFAQENRKLKASVL